MIKAKAREFFSCVLPDRYVCEIGDQYVIRKKKDSILLIVRQRTAVHRQSEPNQQQFLTQKTNEQASQGKGDDHNCSLVFTHRYHCLRIDRVISNQLKTSSTSRVRICWRSAKGFGRWHNIISNQRFKLRSNNHLSNLCWYSRVELILIAVQDPTEKRYLRFCHSECDHFLSIIWCFYETGIQCPKLDRDSWRDYGDVLQRIIPISVDQHLMLLNLSTCTQ